MSPDAMAMAQDAAYALAVSDPLKACQVLLRAVSATQSSGCRNIVLRFIGDEIKIFTNPPASSGATGSKLDGFAGSPSAVEPNPAAMRRSGRSAGRITSYRGRRR